MCTKIQCALRIIVSVIMLPGATYNTLSNSSYAIRKNYSFSVSGKSFNKYSKNNHRDNRSTNIPTKSPLKLLKVINNGKFKSSHSIVPRKSKYKWENKSSQATVPVVTLQDSIHWYNKTPNRLVASSVCQTNIPKPDVKTHYRSSIPFNSVISKGWFSQNVCDIRCVDEVPFDLQSCCFISEQFIPENTLNISKLKKGATKDLRRAEKTDIENDSFVTLSKHKLIRKQIDNVPKIQKLESDLPVVLTRRKLIRKSKLNTNEPAVSMSSIESRIPEQTNAEQNNVVLPELISKKKRTSTPVHLQHNSPLVVLTDRKLVRRPRTQSISFSTAIRRKSSKSISNESPEKLISLNRNKLVRSSLLRKHVRSSKSINSYSMNSVLYHLIQYRRRPYPGSSYALLTRNKLIRRVKFKQKVAEPLTKEVRPLKRLRFSPRTFVMVGSNKLIRKSLFTKCNKTEGQKTTSYVASPSPKIMLNRVLKSPRKRIQLFTNHLSRMKLKYVSERAAGVSRNRFKNRCKNNRRILRRKKNDTVCPAFRKRGECLKYNKKSCSMLHDEKYISLCKNQLKGLCEDATCRLSHDLIPQKVPICLHYLNDSCSVDECTFLHVKPAVEAPICVQFLRGYCESAEKCPHWHLYACQQYKDSSTCEKGDNCHLPHRSIDYFEGKSHNVNQEEGEENTMSWRYFEKNRLSENDDSSVAVIPQRQAMGDLPDFIPL